MGKQRKNWPADLKQTIVLEVLKGEESVASIARRQVMRQKRLQADKRILPSAAATCSGV